MKASAARDLLLALEAESEKKFEYTVDPSRNTKIAEALSSVADELPAAQLESIVARITQSIHWQLLFAVLKKPLPASTEESIASALAKRRDLEAVFFAEARQLGIGAEAAAFVLDAKKSPHLPGLLKRLASKLPVSAKLIDTARKAISEPDMRLSKAEFLFTCALLGILIREGSPPSLEIVERAAAQLEADEKDHVVRDPVRTIQRLREALGGPASVSPPLEPSENPVVELARAQGFSAAGRDFTARVWLAKGTPNEWFGAMQTETQLVLTLDSKVKPYWKVEVRNPDSHAHYANWSGKVLQDDFGLPPLHRLVDVPEWLGPTGEVLGTTFDVANGKSNTGRLRTLAAELRQWLAGRGRIEA